MTTLPTIAQLYAKNRANLDAELGASLSILKKVFLRAYAAVDAAALWLFYKMLAKVQKNVWPDTADSIAQGGTLERFGLIRLGRYPSQAVAGQMDFTVTGTIGAIIPAQTTFKSDDDSTSPGYLFILDAAYALLATTDTVTLRALTPGTVAKLAVGDTVTATKPLVNVNRSAEVAAITVEPLDAESISDYRTKVNNSFRLEAQGGAVGDYRIWAADVQGVKTVYPYAKPGENMGVNIYVEANPADSTDGFGTPSGPMLANIDAAFELNPDTSLSLNERGRRPVGVKAYSIAVTPMPVDIEINGFAGVTAAQQTLILTALTAMIDAIRPFIAGAEPIADKNDIIDTNKVNAHIILAVPGAGYASVTLKVNAVTLATYTFQLGNIPYLNTVTYL